MKRIAVIGTGISGLGAAYLLNPAYDITVYEKADRIGGHSRTVDVRRGRHTIPVDTGFIVFNERNYPHLTALFDHLGVPTHESDMSFSATIRRGWLEWGAKDLNAVFGQRRNLMRPAFHGMVRDVMAFNAGALRRAEEEPHLTLGELVRALGLGAWFRDYYLLPMGGAIWSCPPRQMLDFPAATFTRFFDNHGLLSVDGQPQWRTVTGGARAYVERLTQPFVDKIRVGVGGTMIRRESGHVFVTDARGRTEAFDHVVLACHGDEALALLADPTSDEASVLGAFKYQKNIAVLHSDPRLMPRRRACWASWVYSADEAGAEPAISVTYWMNSLQKLDKRVPVFVTLNPVREIRADRVHDRHVFHHPVFDAEAIAAQGRLHRIQGDRNTWFCGAHWRHGFHEDGLWSAVEVARGLGVAPPWYSEGEAERDAA